MSERAPYSRVYWSVMDDPKFDGIRENPRHLGSWTLLLIVADMSWPAPAFPPPTVPRASMKALVEAELVDTLSGGRFRIHGLDAERGRRRDAARSGGKRDPDGTRTGPEPDPDGPPARGSLDEDETRTSLDETRRGRSPTPRQTVHAWLSDHGASSPTGWVNTTLNELVKVYGADPILTLWSSAPSDVRTSRQFVQLAERSLAPAVHANGSKPGGHTRSAQEVEDAFR